MSTFLQELRVEGIPRNVLTAVAIVLVVTTSILLNIRLAAPRCMEPYYKWNPPALNSNAHGELSILQGPSTPGSNGFVVIVADVEVFRSLYRELLMFADELVNEGMGVDIYGFVSGSPESLRTFLASLYGRGLIGAILVGDIPTAWFEMETSWCYERFPIDLFYMDLNGEWRDNIFPNSVYDTHTGDRKPDIWVGRLKPPLEGEEALGMLKSYFHRNRAYRILNFSLPGKALLFVDDDWSYWADSYASALDDVFEVTTVADRVETNRENYLKQLQEGYSLVQVMAHSYELGSGFTVPFWKPHEGFEDIRVDSLGSIDKKVDPLSSEEVGRTDAKAFFYNLFACSAARFTATNYLGGWYLFGNPYGLAAIGSTKIGSMLYFEEFYSLWKDHNLGQAFKEWLASRIEAEEAGDWYGPNWFYGMTLLGDPTLILHGKRNLTVSLQNLSPSTNLSTVSVKARASDLSGFTLADLAASTTHLERAGKVDFELPPNTTTVEITVEMNGHPVHAQMFTVSPSYTVSITYAG